MLKESSGSRYRRQKIITTNRAYGNRRVATVPQSIAMNREHSKPIHVFRKGSRGYVCARIRNRGKGRQKESACVCVREKERQREGGRLCRGEREKADQRAMEWDDFKAECVRTVACIDATSSARTKNARSYQLFFLAEASRLSFPVLRRLIEKQRFQFCKICTFDKRRECRCTVFHILSCEMWSLCVRVFVPF